MGVRSLYNPHFSGLIGNYPTHYPSTPLPYPSESTETIDEITHWHIIHAQVPRHGLIHSRLSHRQTSRA